MKSESCSEPSDDSVRTTADSALPGLSATTKKAMEASRYHHYIHINTSVLSTHSGILYEIHHCIMAITLSGRLADLVDCQAVMAGCLSACARAAWWMTPIAAGVPVIVVEQ